MSGKQVWHVIIGEDAVEELTSGELLSRIGRDELAQDVLIWRPGMTEWATAVSLRGTELPPNRAVAPYLTLQMGHSEPPVREPPMRLIEEQPETPEAFVVSLSKSKAGNFVVRHWRGEFSLGVSYWVCGGLITVVFSILADSYWLLIDVTTTPRLWAASVWAVLLTTAALSVWQLVGIMRSASRTAREHRARGRPAGWARVAQAVTLIGAATLVAHMAERAPLLGDAYGVFSGVSAPQPHDLRIVNHGREILLAGGIDFGTAADLSKLLEAAHDVKVIDLNSIGGRIAEAEKIGALVKEHKLSTYTNARCVSACTLVFLSGLQRYAGSVAHIGFHSYSVPGALEEERLALERNSRASLGALGVPTGFIARVFATPSNEMWYPTKEELKSANIVTQFVDPYNYSALASGTPPTDRDADKALSAISSLAALKQVDPLRYGQLVKDYIEGTKRGDSVGEITLAANGVVQGYAQKNKLRADDQTLVAVAAYMGVLANVLAIKNPQICMKLLLHGATPLEYMPYETTDLMQQDADLTARLVLADTVAGPRAMPSKADADKSIETIWRYVLASGAHIEGVVKEVRTPLEDAEACRAFGAFFARVGGLPPAIGGPIARYLFSNAGQ